MEKNDFLLFNDIVYQLYSITDFEEMKRTLLEHLKMLIPYSYASILMAQKKASGPLLCDPVCVPAAFRKAEEAYVRMEDEDHTLWLLHTRQSVLLHEGDVVTEQSRLASPIYRKCYSAYQIFDTLQLSLCYNNTFVGILTLYRTRADGVFREGELFYLNALTPHLNFQLYQKYFRRGKDIRCSASLDKLAEQYQLTRREMQVLGMIYEECNNEEIAQALRITPNTLKKHIQNLYRKFQVSTRWDLLKFR